MCNNKLSRRLPVSLKNLTSLKILQLARNELVGSVPKWIGREFLGLRIETNLLEAFQNGSNNFFGNIPHELCYLTAIQILDLANNNLSGNIPRCFNNFSVLSLKDNTLSGQFSFSSFEDIHVLGSASLVTKGREDTYSTILGQVMVFDLSSNNLFGHIPSELMALHALQSLNLSRNQLSGRIPEEIGHMKLLESFDVSLDQLSGELPMSLSSLSFLSSFNVSNNNLTGRIPSSSQLQGFNESSFFGNNVCGDPLTEHCGVKVPDREHEGHDGSYDGKDWGLDN